MKYKKSKKPYYKAFSPNNMEIIENISLKQSNLNRSHILAANRFLIKPLRVLKTIRESSFCIIASQA